MVVSCDRCRKRYEVKLQEKTKSIEGKIISRVSFRCPFCGLDKTVSYSNNAMKALQKQINRMYKKLENPLIDDNEATRLVNKINRKKEKIKQINAELYIMYDEKFREVK